jgi:hypothetical protein
MDERAEETWMGASAGRERSSSTAGEMLRVEGAVREEVADTESERFRELLFFVGGL